MPVSDKWSRLTKWDALNNPPATKGFYKGGKFHIMTAEYRYEDIPNWGSLWTTKFEVWSTRDPSGTWTKANIDIPTYRYSTDVFGEPPYPLVTNIHVHVCESPNESGFFIGYDNNNGNQHDRIMISTSNGNNWEYINLPSYWSDYSKRFGYLLTWEEYVTEYQEGFLPGYIYNEVGPRWCNDTWVFPYWTDAYNLPAGAQYNSGLLISDTLDGPWNRVACPTNAGGYAEANNIEYVNGKYVIFSYDYPA